MSGEERGGNSNEVGEPPPAESAQTTRRTRDRNRSQGGRGGHNRNRNRGRGRNQNTSKKYRSPIEGLEDAVYDIGVPDSNDKLFPNVTKLIGEYAARELTGAGDFRLGLINRELPEIEEPVPPEAPAPPEVLPHMSCLFT